ncbi:cell division protein FtsZ [Cellulophaga sp. HaHa_2_95]|uniref:cell division protein FtsZ n=1 Tax=Cellulophaga TaxID=104264 RepID=UPI001C4F19FD|nr:MULTISPECIES: cell division protein FtsZ [unclassified Cellulophaga]QXP51720.1 cell division protein FtsZ [Cellulophaga sp. HaHa_2_1]QXP55953.1 cell division protein FtsZ [Cellulophaga sp. HaHa_2_95]
MSNSNEFGSISFDLPKNQSNVIKVIGVGGGGSNAINHMYMAGINGVDFIICNTDSQALDNSTVPNKIQLGVSLTEGLGAGANPEVGEQSAIESMEEIKNMLGTNTKMVFITAGMGGGTGTGAAPMIAKQAKELDILTVGIVTIPFQFEGQMRTKQAQAGIEKLRNNVDSLIVINNNKLREVYGNLGFKAGFSKADEVLATAARGIAEVITHHYTQNIDLRDAKTVLSNSGTAIMGSSTSSGSNRANEAIMSALDSPLLNDNKISGAKNVLLLIVSGTKEITIDEIGEINDHIQTEAGHSANIIMGVGEDETLGEAIAVTVIATGFNIDQQDTIVNTESKKIIHTLEDSQKAEQVLMGSENVVFQLVEEEEEKKVVKEEPKIVKHVLEEDKPEMDLIPTSSYIKNFNVFYDEVIADNVGDDFIIVDSKAKIDNFEVIDPITVSSAKIEDDQFIFSFDGPEAEKIKEDKKENVVLFSLDDEVRDMEVKDPIEVIPVVEYNKQGEKRYSLDDYMELEGKLNDAKSKAEKVAPKVLEEELRFEQKTVEKETKQVEEVADVDPMDMPLEELLRSRSEERKRKLKDFNYKFQNNNAKHIDEIEKHPAYKRQGVHLNEVNRENKISRTSLSEDSNDDIQIRTNNSFLHDNVD